MLIIFSPGRPRHLQSCWKKYKNHDNDGEATGIYSVYIHRVWGIFYSFFRKIWHNYELYENMIILLHGREKIASSCLICVWMIRLDRLQWAGLSSWGKHCWSVCRSVYGPLRCGYTGRDGWSWVGLARARARLAQGLGAERMATMEIVEDVKIKPGQFASDCRELRCRMPGNESTEMNSFYMNRYESTLREAEK